MTHPSNQQEEDMETQDSGSQALLSLLGATPVDPTLPAQEEVDATLTHMKALVETDEYKQLVADRSGNLLSKEAFDQAVRELSERLEASGELN